MGQAASTEQQLTEDLQRVDSWHRELSAKVVDTHIESTFVSSEWGLDRRDLQTHYTIETTDRHGNSWKVDTHYSVVVELLAQLQRDRGLDLPSMPPKYFRLPFLGGIAQNAGFNDTADWLRHRSLQEDVVSERRKALDAVLAALIPQHAGIPAVRSFLEISTGEDLKMQRQEEQVREEARRREEAQRRPSGSRPRAPQASPTRRRPRWHAARPCRR